MNSRPLMFNSSKLITLFSPNQNVKTKDLITIPLKTSSNVDLIEPFKNLIALRFSTADEPANFHHSGSERETALFF